jgi:3-deoxy-D-arabino-heptulosonate 7-phosphate (DAHP) synthase
VMAGPCSVESEAQVLEVAEAVKGAGARILRGGAYKPRPSPYAFQGLKEQGLRYLAEVGSFARWHAISTRAPSRSCCPGPAVTVRTASRRSLASSAW